MGREVTMGRAVPIATIICLLFASCTNDSESDLVEIEPDKSKTISYEADIRQIIGNNCLDCHKSPPVNGAPFSLDTYDRVKDKVENGNLITAINRQSGEPAAMPPTGRLPKATIDLIEQWADEGFLEQ